MSNLITEYEGKNKGLLGKCSVCGNLISTQAEMCPHCGHPDPNNLESQRNDAKFIQKIFISVLFIVVLLLLYYIKY